jgi:hypothetical protein
MYLLFVKKYDMIRCLKMQHIKTLTNPSKVVNKLNKVSDEDCTKVNNNDVSTT